MLRLICTFLSFFSVLVSENYLVSYPRSGLNWTLYQLVNLTHQTCITDNWYNYWDQGVCKHAIGTYDRDLPYIIYSVHSLEDLGILLDAGQDKVVLLLRDYKECFCRNVGYEIKRLVDLITMRSDYVRLSGSYDSGHAYFTNLYAYDEFEGKKLLIYYEDMILHPKETMRTLIDFLDAPAFEFDEFFQSLSAHRKKSMDFYQFNGGSKSGGKNLHYHSKKLPKNIIKYLDDLVETHHPVLYEKYLKRYRLDQI